MSFYKCGDCSWKVTFPGNRQYKLWNSNPKLSSHLCSFHYVIQLFFFLPLINILIFILLKSLSVHVGCQNDNLCFLSFFIHHLADALKWTPRHKRHADGHWKGCLPGSRLPFWTDHRIIHAYTKNQPYRKQKESSVNQFKLELHVNTDRPSYYRFIFTVIYFLNVWHRPLVI